MDFIQHNDIPGLTKYNLINIIENNPCGMSFFWFIFFTFIGMAQIYKMYINSKSIYKSFTIRKLISTRNSLFSLECDEKYDKLDPVISFGENEINFTSKDISYVSKILNKKFLLEKKLNLLNNMMIKYLNLNQRIKNQII